MSVGCRVLCSTSGTLNVTSVAVNSLASTLTQCNLITDGMLHVRFACTRASQAWRGSALNAMWRCMPLLGAVFPVHILFAKNHRPFKGVDQPVDRQHYLSRWVVLKASDHSCYDTSAGFQTVGDCTSQHMLQMLKVPEAVKEHAERSV